MENKLQLQEELICIIVNFAVETEIALWNFLGKRNAIRKKNQTLVLQWVQVRRDCMIRIESSRVNDDRNPRIKLFLSKYNEIWKKIGAVITPPLIPVARPHERYVCCFHHTQRVLR